MLHRIIASAGFSLVVFACLEGCDRSGSTSAGSGTAVAPQASSAAPKKKHEPIADYRSYEPMANGAELIETAATQAKSVGKRVLVMFGGNWCVWCRSLDGLFAGDPGVKAVLEENFVLVHVDTDTNLPLNEKYGNPFQHGFPVLLVLDAEGQKLHVQETGSLESGDKSVSHNPGKVVEFLRRWAPPRG